MTHTPYRLTIPGKQTTPVIFASPHSGRDYPHAFHKASVLDTMALRSSEDAFVDLLFDTAPSCGAPLLCASVPRAYLDLNRDITELDAALIKGMSAKIISPYVSSGLGVIPRVVSGGRAIFRGKIPIADAQDRIRTYWHPYHARLARLLHDSREIFGQAVLIDCHSMPHEALKVLETDDSGLPDVVLGDRFGASANAEIVDHIEAAFQTAGLKVTRNKPFAGAYIAQTYGRPSHNQHVVQIEIDRSLYMHEAEMRPNNNFQPLKLLLNQVISEIVTIGRDAVPLAAE